MKVTVLRIPVSNALPFELADLKHHCRVEFDDDDAEITNIGLSAAAELEQFAQVALLTQDIEVTALEPSFQRAILTLPIGPLDSSVAPSITMDGEDFTAFEHVGGNRPAIRFLCDYLDIVTGRMVISYRAGFGDSASDIPADLARALMDQAGMHYEGRSPLSAKTLTTSPHMARIAARYRGVQL